MILGVPMLIIHDPSQQQARYSAYLGELLQSEGLATQQHVTLADLDMATAQAADLIVLPRMALAATHVDIIAAAVAQGTHLLCLMPAPTLATRLGITLTHRVIPHGRVSVDSALLPHLDAPVSLDVLTPALCWQVPAASTILASIDTQPAIVRLTYGQGSVTCIGFDVAATVARLRHGDPAMVDCHTAGLDGIYRPSELFVHQLDPARAHIPQADLYTAMLALLICAVAPQPRLWYYPHVAQQSVMLMTSDDDWSQVSEFTQLIDALAAHDATCTFYLVPQSRVSTQDVARWQAAGHTFSVHPALDADIVVGLATDVAQPHVVAPMLAANVARHQRTYGGSVTSIRQHAVRWLGYVEAARILAGLGVRMDCNYLAVSPYLGYLCGSGRPLPFVDEQGALIDCWQQPTLWTEECLIHPEYVFSFKWSLAQAVAATDALVAAAAMHYYTPVAINSHPVSFATYSQPLIEANWRAAQRHGMPIQNVDSWCDWTLQRHAVTLSHTHDGWYLHTPQALAHVSLLLPISMTPLQPVPRVTRWGQEWWGVELHDLAAGMHLLA